MIPSLSLLSLLRYSNYTRNLLFFQVGVLLVFFPEVGKG